MTTPGGVPNLPVGALTLDTLAEKIQDMTPTAMRSRAAERMPSTFDSSTGGNPLSDLSPFGILTQLWAGFNSVVANADPADIEGPEDLPGLLLDFIESLPIVGQFVGLLEAIMGTYDGDDSALLLVQDIFTLIRSLFGGLDFSDPGSLDIADVWSNIISTILDPLGLLARLSGGKLLDSQAPNVLTNLLFGNLLDASKLTNLSGNAGLSSENPAVVALDGRVSALESSLGSWIDNLNRTSLGANYTVLSGSVNMTGQVMESNSGVAGRVVYVDELFQSAQHYAQATAVGAPRPGRSRIAIMGDSTLATCCYIEYYAGVFGFGSQVRIVSRISGTEAIRDAANYSWSNGDVIGIGYDPASETYVGYVNNVAKVSWPDTANLVATTGRHSGLAVNLDADITTRGCAWDDYAAYDWS